MYLNILEIFQSSEFEWMHWKKYTLVTIGASMDWVSCFTFSRAGSRYLLYVWQRLGNTSILCLFDAYDVLNDTIIYT